MILNESMEGSTMDRVLVGIDDIFKLIIFVLHVLRLNGLV